MRFVRRRNLLQVQGRQQSKIVRSLVLDGHPLSNSAESDWYYASGWKPGREICQRRRQRIAVPETVEGECKK